MRFDSVEEPVIHRTDVHVYLAEAEGPQCPENLRARDSTTLISKNFYSTAFAPGYNFYIFNKLLKE